MARIGSKPGALDYIRGRVVESRGKVTVNELQAGLRARGLPSRRQDIATARRVIGKETAQPVKVSRFTQEQRREKFTPTRYLKKRLEDLLPPKPDATAEDAEWQQFRARYGRVERLAALLRERAGLPEVASYTTHKQSVLEGLDIDNPYR